jgi:plastocyanin/peptidoglycan hydrolase-like protein with peptidoglycan-binding domain
MKAIIRILILGAVFVPALASAQAQNDVVTQAQALLNQILQLQQQLGGQSGEISQTLTAGGSCAAPSKTLKPGSRGADVTTLQTFLARDTAIYPEGTISGYYGALTQAAVGRWQAAQGIVSSGSPSSNGYGAVGPRTLAAMQASCGGATGSASVEPVVGGYMNVSPVSGNAPLSVSVEATINTVKSCNGSIYTLSWGDASAPISISVPAGRCDTFAQTYTHTYTQGGSYEIKLSSGGHESSSVVQVSGGTSSSNTNTGTAGTLGTQNNPGESQITMTADSFSPSTLTISSGTKVTWINTDSKNHTVTADNASYQSGTLAPGEKYSLTFTIKGEYNYFCSLHGQAGGVGMSGRIIVQ